MTGVYVPFWMFDCDCNVSGAYLSGYLADKYDVSIRDSIKRANERVKNSTIKAFNDTAGRYTAVIPEKSRVGFSNGKIRYSLLPVWMLNIKYMDKMYKFAINGQTGKVVGKYPIDNGEKLKYLIQTDLNILKAKFCHT